MLLLIAREICNRNHIELEFNVQFVLGSTGKNETFCISSVVVVRAIALYMYMYMVRIWKKRIEKNSTMIDGENHIYSMQMNLLCYKFILSLTKAIFVLIRCCTINRKHISPPVFTGGLLYKTSCGILEED